MGKTVLTLATVMAVSAVAPALAGNHGGYCTRYWVEQNCNSDGLDCVARMRYAPGQGPMQKAAAGSRA